ncbi:hypothetical protein [Pseudomonas cavernae]|uniref:hypothetical protein n=1 Tax=Pseudomonas cavernae TaxID=2320867 RepID=UPI001EE54355|nr:hypothetical protein [Pseudomonas cavernae]
MLQRQRGDFLVDYQIAVEQSAQQLGISTPPSIQLQRIPMQLIVSKRSPDAARLLEALERAYEELQASGEALGDQRRGLARAVGSAISGSSGQ